MIVNKPLLRDIFKPNPSAECIKEVRKVIHIVLCCHFSKHLNDPDLVQLAYYEILKRSDRYDPQYDAYNYIYTVCRDQIGNFLKRNHDTPVEDVVAVHEDLVDGDYGEVPPVVDAFRDELLGLADYNYRRVSRKKAFALLVWLRMHSGAMPRKTLLDISSYGKEELRLYRLCQDLYGLLVCGDDALEGDEDDDNDNDSDNDSDNGGDNGFEGD